MCILSSESRRKCILVETVISAILALLFVGAIVLAVYAQQLGIRAYDIGITFAVICIPWMVLTLSACHNCKKQAEVEHRYRNRRGLDEPSDKMGFLWRCWKPKETKETKETNETNEKSPLISSEINSDTV